MLIVARPMVLFLMLLTSSCVGQPADIPELLVKPSRATIDSAIARNAAKIQSSKSQAKQGKFEIFRFDIELLEAAGEDFTVTLFGDSPIIVTSFGVHRERDSGFISGTWTGEIKDPDDQSSYPLELSITTWAVDEDGNYGFPSPYQTTVDADSNSSITIRPAGTVPDEVVVYSVVGRIYVPFRKTLYRVVPIQHNPDFSMIYESDSAQSP